MGKITLSEALKKATIENNLQNYLGLNADGALGKMTPERLASVVGGLIETIGNKLYVGEYLGNTNDPVEVAKEVVGTLPDNYRMFMVLHGYAGKRIVRGVIYPGHTNGTFYIENLDGSIQIVLLSDGNYSLKQ